MITITMTRMLVLGALLLGLSNVAGLAQAPAPGSGLAYVQSSMVNIYTAITPNLLDTDTGVGTGGITLRGAAGADGIATWNVASNTAIQGSGASSTNVGY